MIGIYKFTNLINNKSYIGQSIDISKRYYQHSVNHLNPNQKEYNTYFYKALRKYGFNNFNFMILEITDTNKLDEREQYWINYYKSNDSNFGYNCTIGGKTSNKTPKKIYQFDLQGNFINVFNNSKEAAIIIFNDVDKYISINACAYGKTSKTYYNYIFSYNETLTQDELQERLTIKSAHRLKATSKDKKTTLFFNSTREAERELGISHTNITKVLKGERKSAGGYFWEEI